MDRLTFKVGIFLLGELLMGIMVGLLIFQQDTGETAAIHRLRPPTVGSAVPDFELSMLDGTSLALNEFKGRPVMINFWATWCAPCTEEMPLLEAYAQKYRGKLAILGINAEEEVEVVQPFTAEVGISFPILLDQAGIVSDLYFVKNFPYTFFVDESGILRGQHIGLLSEERLVKYLKTIGIEP